MRYLKYTVFALVFLLGISACGEDNNTKNKQKVSKVDTKEMIAKRNEMRAKQREALDEKMAKISCEDAGGALKKNQAMVHIKTLLEKKCPVIYRMGWLKDDKIAKMPMVKGCPKIFKALRSKGMLLNAGAFIKNSCKQ